MGSLIDAAGTLWVVVIVWDAWSGVGRIAVGGAHHGFNLQLTRYDDRG